LTDQNDPSTLTAGQRRWRINVLAATWLSYVGYYFCRKVFGIVKKDLSDAYGFSDLELAHIWTAFLVAYMVGQFLSAGLGTRLTCRRLLLVGMAVSICATVLVGGATTFGHAGLWGMIVFMVLNGMAQATGWPGNIGLLSRWTRRHERGTVVALWATCYQIGSILAKHFAAFMLALLGIAWSFYAASLVLLAIWAFFLFFGKDRPEDVGLPPLVEEVPAEEPTSDPHDGPDAPAPLIPERSRRQVMGVVIAMGLIYFCFKFIRYALDSWAPMILAEMFTLQGSTAGHISTTFDWIGFMGVVVAGVGSDRLFRSRRAPVIFIMSLGMGASTLGLLLLGQSSLMLFAVFLGLIGFMLMGPDSLLSGTAAMEVSSKEFAVVASGIINGLGSIGPIVQEEVIGFIKGAYGVDAVLALLVGVAALAVISTGALWGVTSRMDLRI